MAKDWYKKKKADSLDAAMDNGMQVRDRTASPEVLAQYTELLETIADMQETDREVLLLRHVEGLNPQDIAEILDESANTISVRINRATNRLRKSLEHGA